MNLLLVAPTAITTVRIMQAIRLKSVEVWTNPVALGSAPTDVKLEWLGENSPSTLIEDVSMGIRPAHIFAVPPPSTSNKWWSISGGSETDVLFKLYLMANSVIDVTCDCRNVDDEAPTAGDVPAAASIGQLYGDYLDGLTSGKLLPVGYIVLP